MSVRQRLVRAAEKPERQVSLSDKPRSTLCVASAPPTSVRSRAEASREETPLDTSGTKGSGYTSETIYNTSVRGRASIAETKREMEARPAPSAIAEQYLAEYDHRQAAEKARHDAEVASGKLKYV